MATSNDEEAAELFSRLDKFIADSATASINKKINEIGAQMIKFLAENPEAINDYNEATRFTEILGSHWVSNQNPKVSQYGLEALIMIAEAMQSNYKNYCAAVIPHALSRLGDSKEAVREKSRSYLVKTVEVGAQSPSNLIEKLIPLLTSKSRDLSIEAQKTVIDILLLNKNKKISSTALHELLKIEAVFLTTHLHDDAAKILLDLAERIGKQTVVEQIEKHRPKIANYHHKRMTSLIEEIRAKRMDRQGSGTYVTADDEEDEPDFVEPKPKKIPPPKTTKTKPAPPSAGGTGKGIKHMRSTKIGEGEKYSLHSGHAGEADEAWFLSAFEDVPDITILSHREFTNLTNKIIEDLKSGTEFWERKVEAFKKLRSMILNLPEYDAEIQAFIKNISLILMTLLKDLRSQVVRETCLTFAFICKELKNKVDIHTCEIIMVQLMNNVMSSAKVIVTSSHVALKFMFTYVNHSKLISVLVQTMANSKSREVRTATCEFLYLALQTWPVNRLEQQIPTIQEGIKRGVTDTTTEGRMFSRKSYFAFRAYFPEQGDLLLNSMDKLCKKQLMAGEHPDIPSNSSKSRPATTSRPAVARQAGPGGDAPVGRRYSPTISSVRSNSAIDLQAVQRAKARLQYAALARQKVGCVASLPRPKKVDTPVLQNTLASNLNSERSSRTRGRVAGVSHSQPSSRSGSPSSRLGYHTYNMPETNSLSYQVRRNPRSQGTSRETSPNRFGSKSSLTNLFGTKRRLGLNERPPIQPPRPVMAQKMLAQSLEAEGVSITASELYEADNADNMGHKVSPRKTSYRPFEDHSDDSDASSLCSERSFDSYRRTSDNISEIIFNCESTHWSDRKEGLVALQSYLQAGNTLGPCELKRVTDIFTRMFMDSHTKVFSLFLDTLNELILIHRGDLNPWLYVLLTRLLNKLGADLLGSIQNKIFKSLDVVRESFPPELQMASVLRFLTDPTQTPNLRVKTAALNFITKLASISDPSNAFPPPSPGQTREPVQAALHKMIGWTMGDSIKQGNELRRAAQEAILALFNLNTPQVTLRLANLPQEYQEAAATLLKGRVRRGSTSSGGGITANSPPSPSARDYPRLSSPAPHHVRHLPDSKQNDSDVLNPEEIYKSLRKTTAEIQNYTYETGTEKPPDKDNTTSKDSGISQLSGTEAIEEAMEELSLQSSSSSNATTSTLTNRVLTAKDCNEMDTVDSVQPDGSLIDEQEAMRKIVEALRSPPDSDNGENISVMSDIEKRASLGQLTRLIRNGSVSTLQEHFKALLRILLGNLALDSNSRDVQSRILVLAALSELIKKRALLDCFNNYVELLILKVLNSYKDVSKEVVRNAESCANTIATTIAPEMVIRVLAPLIQTGEYPLNLAAIKMLTRLVEHHGRDPVYNYLPSLMPGLIQAYDNVESSVRKSAVFCMVSLHAAIGEEDLKPHLAALNGSKLKLLHLYIRRAQQGSSAPTSPRNHPPPPS